ncbi:chromosome transmission fidelity protein 8 homolog [Salvia splendens]|uniref:chromosome transmission fidelity protein 8 homolog n=1 Tax=Salvia splendens TaxID=180675 RepID=UPI001C28129A|nr:chromosome transmission fidelity protein 8 homolog [Salvia splendens]
MTAFYYHLRGKKQRVKELSRQIVHPQNSFITHNTNHNEESAKSEMLIQVKCSCGERQCPEWAIVELQGTVEAQPSFQDRIQNLQIGLLLRPSTEEIYTLVVGYHELTGSKQRLKKPILVLKKIEGGENSDSKRVELDVIGVIRHKILFKTRPKAIISSRPQPAAKGKNSAHASSVLN